MLYVWCVKWRIGVFLGIINNLVFFFDVMLVYNFLLVKWMVCLKFFENRLYNGLLCSNWFVSDKKNFIGKYVFLIINGLLLVICNWFNLKIVFFNERFKCW